MKCSAALLAAAIALVTGCGATAPPPASQAGASASTTPSASAAASTPPSCHQQYKTWQDGPARPLGKQIVPALKKVDTAATSEDIPELNSALKAAGDIARRLTAYPMPACADPKGYWTKMLRYLQAAGDNASTSSGLAGLITAMAPLEKVPAVENKLEAEIKKNARAT
jgi:hypothetical protein